MGVYQYTLRSATKNVGGVHIAQFKFAYKQGWGVERLPSVKSQLAAAERAASKLRHEGVRLAVQGNFYDGQPVYWFDPIFSDFTEELVTTPQVGWLVKDGRGRWHYDAMRDEDLLAKFPEIGVLQTEDGPRYYVNDDRHINGELVKYRLLYRAVKAALIQRLIKGSKAA